MKNSRIRPRRGNGRKVAVMKNREAYVTQMQLAQIQQLQSDLTKLEAGDGFNHLQGNLRRQWNTVRMQLLRGVSVEPGPIRAFLRKSGNTQKLIVK